MSRKKVLLVMSDVDKLIYQKQRQLKHTQSVITAPELRGRPKPIHDRLKIMNRILELRIEIELLQKLNEKQLHRAA